LLILFFYIDIN